MPWHDSLIAIRRARRFYPPLKVRKWSEQSKWLSQYLEMSSNRKVVEPRAEVQGPQEVVPYLFSDNWPSDSFSNSISVSGRIGILWHRIRPRPVVINLIQITIICVNGVALSANSDFKRLAHSRVARTENGDICDVRLASASPILRFREPLLWYVSDNYQTEGILFSMNNGEYATK